MSFRRPRLGSLPAMLALAMPIAATHAAAPANAASAPPAAAARPAIAPQRLAELCDACAVVTEVRTETRQGKGGAVGVVGGAVVGGLLGHQVGGGTGKTLATIGGAAAGGYAGNEVQKHVTKKTVWVTRVTMKDGSSRSFENSDDPGFKVDEVVTVAGNALQKR